MPEPLRVLHMLPNTALGGGQVLLLRNVQGLDPARVRSHVCAVWRDGPTAMTDRYLAAGIPVVNLELRRSLLPLALGRLVRYVRRHRIDLIHTNNTRWDRGFGAAAGALCRLPVVNTYHSMRFPRRAAPVEAWDAWLMRGRVRRGIAVSHVVRDAWLADMRAIGLQDADIHVISAGADVGGAPARLPLPAARALRRRIGLADRDGPLLVHVARFVPGKGLLDLVPLMERVAQERPRAKLLLVGDGPERARVEAALRERRLERSVLLLGQRDDVPDVLALADLFVFPSAGEGLPIAVLEAMAASKPVVAYDVPALREALVPGESGLLVPHGDVDRLAAAALDLLEHPAERARLGACAAEHVVRRFSRQEALRALEAVYLAAAGRTREGRPRAEASSAAAPRAKNSRNTVPVSSPNSQLTANPTR